MANQNPTPRDIFTNILRTYNPSALAWVQGSPAAPSLSGLVRFYDTPYGGVLIEAEIFGLPNIVSPGSSGFYAMHIHDYGDCSNHFMNTGGHFNPTNALHPDHAGDLLPLLSNQGYAWSSFYDKRFTIPQIIGKSLVIHLLADDFTSQPAGNSGEKIGCGVIRMV